MYKKLKKSISWGESQGVIAKLKQYEEYAFLKEVNSQSLQYAHKCLRIAYKRFFDKQGGFPNYKKKTSKGSFTIPQNISLQKISSKYSLVLIPKFRNGIKVRTHKKIDGEIREASIVQESDGSYYLNVLVKKDNFHVYPEISGEVGIDLGLTAFLIMDDGTKVSAPRYLQKMERKLRIAQRRLAKKRKKSSNYEKMRHQLAILHQKVKNRRKHFLHELSSSLVRENQVIYMEDLHVAGMMQNHRLAKSITDAGWSTFVTYVLYKAAWYGRKVVQIDRFAPSSKMCSTCGFINDDLKLGDREWCCQNCQAKHDRDINAAKNIKKLGQGMPDVKPEERAIKTNLNNLKIGSKIQEPSP